MSQSLVAAEVCPLPAFLTGTSTEYIGQRPVPRVVATRSTVFVLGPKGCGKSTVARSLASEALTLDNRACQAAIIDCVRNAAWSEELLHAESLVLDGPVWLHNRPGALRLLGELVNSRAESGLRTIICQSDTDASVTLLLDATEPGSSAVVALRFPKSPKARRRVAERICSVNGVSPLKARRTSGLPDWSYSAVIAAVRR